MNAFFFSDFIFSTLYNLTSLDEPEYTQAVMSASGIIERTVVLLTNASNRTDRYS